VSKRKRKDRRKAQQERALERGDLTSLQASTVNSPETAGHAVIRALRAGSLNHADPSVQSMSAALCERLRQAVRPDLVLTLTACFPTPSTALRLERGLAALSLGDDGVAAAQVATDPIVAKALAPALAAVNGSPVPRAPAHSPKDLRSVYALCRAAAAAHRGSTSAARTALAAVDSSCQGALRADQFRDLITLLHGRAGGGRLERTAIGFAKTSLADSHTRVAGAFAMALACRAPALLLNKLLPVLKLAPQDKAAAAVQATVSSAGMDSERARVFQIIATVGADAFPNDHKAQAYLYDGFARVMTDPVRARESLDRAVALGADLGEALRGRAIAERRAAEMTRDVAKLRDAGTASLRLAKALTVDDDGVPLAYVAACDAMLSFRLAKDAKSCREAVAQVRVLAERGGWSSNEIESGILTNEASTYVGDDKRVDALLVRAIELDPKNEEAWMGRIAIADAHGEFEQAEQLVLQADEAGAGPGVAKRARDIRARRGERWSPAPGACSVGELANELHERLGRGDPRDDSDPLPFADLRACRDALSQQQRCALDAAQWICLASMDRNDEASKLLRSRVLSSDCAEPEQAKLILIACGFGEPSGGIDLLVELVAGGKHKALLAAAARAVASRQGGDEADTLSRRAAAHLAPSELERLREASWSDDAPELDAAIKELDALLAPQFSLRGTAEAAENWFDEYMGDELDDSDLDMMEPLTEAHVEMLFQQIGLPMERYWALLPGQRARIVQLAEKMLLEFHPSLFLDILRELGLAPGELAAPPSRRARGRR
jgi:hypothetical protein